MYTVSFRRLTTPSRDRAPAWHPRKKRTPGRERHFKPQAQAMLRARMYITMLGLLYSRVR